MQIPNEARRPHQRERIRQLVLALMKITGWTSTQFARAAGLAPSTLNKYLKQEVAHTLSTSTLEKLYATAMDRHRELTLSDIAGQGEEEAMRLAQARHFRLLKVLSDIHPAISISDEEVEPIHIMGEAREGVFAHSIIRKEPLRTISLPADRRYPGKTRFAFLAAGASMDRVYPEGSVVVMITTDDLERPPENGEHVLAIRKQGQEYELTIKKFVVDKAGTSWLWPESSHPKYQEPWLFAKPDDERLGQHGLAVAAIVVASYRPE